MKSDQIGVGLIGLGRHGMRYARHLVQDLPMVSLRAVCRRHPDQGCNLPEATSVAVYGEAEALIADPSVDVVVVVVPPVETLTICRLAVQAHKPLLIEKPLAVTEAEARMMVALAREANVPLMTAQTLRFDSAIREVQKLRHHIGRSERLSLVSHIETKPTAPNHAEGYGKRGALLEIGVHMLDLARYLTGAEGRAVRCSMDQVPPAAQETTASAQLTMQDGTVCDIEIARVTTARIGQATWIGSQGRLEVDWIHRRVHGTTETGPHNLEVPPSQTVLDTLKAFLQALREGTAMPIAGEDGWRAVQLAEACYRSAQAGGVLVTLPTAP